MEYKKEFIPTVCMHQDCSFHDSCALLQTEIVKTRNDDQIDLMFIGQGAGEKEHITHHPFTGPAGKLLREKLLPHLESKKLNIILDNTIRSRPLDEKGKNRAPTQDEVVMCLPIVWQRIVQYKPSIIIPLGASASGDMVPALYKKPINAVRGRTYIYQDKTFVPTIHPAAILHARDPDTKQEYHTKIEQDLELAVKNLTTQMCLI